MGQGEAAAVALAEGATSTTCLRKAWGLESLFMENQFAVQVHEFFVSQNEATRLGILEFYTHGPPNNMYLLWAASHDNRLSERAKQASVLLDSFFLSNKNNYISFELAHRQAEKLFKRKYLDRHVPASELR